jgi:molybdenum cofactor biosynthesis enzyme MoaA
MNKRLAYRRLYSSCSKAAASTAAPAIAKPIQPQVNNFDMNAFQPNTKTDRVERSILEDTFGRWHTYLRVSLTEKCNLRCTYCMPEEGVKLTQNEKLLTGSEIVTLVGMFARLGVNKVRFTGGEPLVRKDCLDIIRECGKIESINKIAMTTNGIVLAKKLSDLKAAGLNQLNISLDTLEEKKFEFIAKRKGWSRVMHSIEEALRMDFTPLKV